MTARPRPIDFGAIEERRQRFRPRIKDAATLLKTDLVPVVYAIDRWVTEGLTMIAAPPKLGKSTLALQMAVAKAAGGEFWGAQQPPGRVLIIDMETNERRLRRKLMEAGVQDLPANSLRYATDWPRGAMGIDQIALAVDEDPSLRFIVVDTLQRFRSADEGKRNLYAADYEALAPLQQLCRDCPGLAIVVIHHLRKAATDDPVDSINGSSAIAGAVDAIWILKRRKDKGFVLHVQGRDWEREQDEFQIERRDMQWAIVQPEPTSSQREILGLLDRVGGMTAKDVASALGITRQAAYPRLNALLAEGLVSKTGDVWSCNA